MTATASGSRKLKRNKLPKFNNDIYSGISTSNLIVYAVHYLLEQHIEIKLEDIVFACFLLFPHKFALKQFPRWPDSALVSRRLSDCRSKGYFSPNTDLGFKLTAKGSRLAEKTAKALGVFKVKRAVKAAPAKPKKQTTPLAKKIKSVSSKERATKLAKVVRAVSSQPKVSSVRPIKKTKILPKKKGASPASIKKSQASSTKASPTKQVQKVTPPTPTKKVLPVRAKKTASKVALIVEPVKKTATPEIKEQPTLKAKKKQSSKTIATAPPKPAKKIRVIHTKKVSSPVVAVKQTKKTQAVRREKTILPAPKKQTEQHVVQVKKTPAMLVPKVVVKPQKKQWDDVVKKRLSDVTLAQQITPPRNIKLNPIVPVLVRPVKAKKAQPEKVNFVASPITKEVKERAGKFTRMMERSDAYLHYKKHASNSKISEFDFRSLLLCTMESSPETLARNVELFKGYAGINNREDLTMFLNFCEDRFSYLLKSQKPVRKAKK